MTTNNFTFGGDWEIPNLYHFGRGRNYLVFNGKHLFFVGDVTSYNLPWINHQHQECGTEVCLPISKSPAKIVAAAKDLVTQKHTIWHSYTYTCHGGHVHVKFPEPDPCRFASFGESLFKISPYFLELLTNSPRDGYKSIRIKINGTQYYDRIETYCRYTFPYFYDYERKFTWITVSRAITNEYKDVYGVEIRFPDLPKTPSSIIAIFAMVLIAYQNMEFFEKINAMKIDFVDKLLDIDKKPEYIYDIGNSKVLELLESYKYYSPENDKYLNYLEFISQCPLKFIPKMREKPGKYREFYLHKFKNPILENYYKINNKILKKLRWIEVIKK